MKVECLGDDKIKRNVGLMLILADEIAAFEDQLMEKSKSIKKRPYKDY